ncbi:MAG: type II toxin-antitoxin system MqsR family toxin [Candidatus Wallbacteria bacterium]|nr:type II toxin-antitoxin system MqsR family toxin [Candidatus Wallbacteria bacterium]
MSGKISLNTLKLQKIRQAVVDFLSELKEVIDTGKFYLIDRDKNLKFAAELGITREMIKSTVRELEAENYYQGPTPDRDKPGEVWEFGKELMGREIYIKVKIVQGQCKVICISFHEAESGMTYPLR